MPQNPHEQDAPFVEPPSHQLRLRWLACATGLWLLALVPGVRALLRYEATPGKKGHAPEALRHDPSMFADARLPMLLVALTPRCACSNATLAELEEASQEFHTPYSAVLLIDTPRGSTFDWHQVRSYREAQEALHARFVLDEDGKLAASFGALTSGDVRLYSAEDSSSQRMLLFAGGVTGGRGMVGDNNGAELLKAAFANPRRSVNSSAPVFGCSLFNPLKLTAAGGKNVASRELTRK